MDHVASCDCDGWEKNITPKKKQQPDFFVGETIDVCSAQGLESLRVRDGPRKNREISVTIFVLLMIHSIESLRKNCA